jgi:hypothetical protein
MSVFRSEVQILGHEHPQQNIPPSHRRYIQGGRIVLQLPGKEKLDFRGTSMLTADTPLLYAKHVEMAHISNAAH